MIVKGEEKQNKTSKDEKITGSMVESMSTISSEVTYATTALKERYRMASVCKQNIFVLRRVLPYKRSDGC